MGTNSRNEGIGWLASHNTWGGGIRGELHMYEIISRPNVDNMLKVAYMGEW